MGHRLGSPWLQMDDLRLVLQYGDLLTAATHPTLFTFLGGEEVWQKPPLVLRDQLIAIGALLAPAIEMVVTHHLTTGKPVILEGGRHPAVTVRADGLARRRHREAGTRRIPHRDSGTTPREPRRAGRALGQRGLRDTAPGE